MIPGAISSTSGVGDMKMRMNKLGAAMLSAVQNRLKTAAVPRAYFSVRRILSPRPAPKFVEMMGREAWPTL